MQDSNLRPSVCKTDALASELIALEPHRGLEPRSIVYKTIALPDKLMRLMEPLEGLEPSFSEPKSDVFSITL